MYCSLVLRRPVSVCDGGANESERQMKFKGLALDEALTLGGFAYRHQYIKWPQFGYVQTKPGIAQVSFRESLPTYDPSGLVQELADDEVRPLTAAELAEFVGAFPEELAESPLIALGECICLLGYGYPIAYLDGDRRVMNLWYFGKEDKPIGARIPMVKIA